MISDLDDLIKHGYYESPLGEDKVDWFVNQVKKIRKKWPYILKTLRMILFWHRKIRKILIKIIFSEKEKISDKVRDHCHLTGKYRRRTHSKCNINVI